MIKNQLQWQVKVVKCIGGTQNDFTIQRQGCNIRSYMGWLSQENELPTTHKPFKHSFLPFQSYYRPTIL
jgi:hypothetical protein